MTKVLSVASECVPLVKTGGLADVVGLPLALKSHDVEMRILLPGYHKLWHSWVMLKPYALWMTYGGQARLLAAKVSNSICLFWMRPIFMIVMVVFISGRWERLAG